MEITEAVVIAWTQVIAFVIIALQIIAGLIINKPNNRIGAILGKMLVVGIIASFCFLLYIAIKGIYCWNTWLYCLTIVGGAMFVLILRRNTYLRDLKEAAIIIKKRWANSE